MLVTIPMWINTLLRTYAWISLLSDNGIVNSFLKMIGLNPVNMMYTNFSVVMGLVCDLVPFMVAQFTHPFKKWTINLKGSQRFRRQQI